MIAGHRGYGGASYFRYIDQLQIGDTVTVTNLWDQLTYQVAEIKIIYPYEVDEILIQPGAGAADSAELPPLRQRWKTAVSGDL